MGRKNVLIVEGTLASERPDIMEDWDFERNTLNPRLVKTNSQSVAYFRCHNDPTHTWMNTIAQMTCGAGCPGCIGGADRKIPRKVPAEGESFADLYPEFAEEWHPQFNGDLKPSQLTCGLPYKYWWRCEKHDIAWLASPYERSQGRICPICNSEARKKATRMPEEGKSFGDLYPEYVEEWDKELNEDTPFDYKPNSKHVAHFICPKHDIKYSTSIRSKAKGVGCKECTNEKIGIANSTPTPGRSLAELRPDIAAEWCYELNEGVTPSDVYVNSTKKYYWICPNNPKHHYLATVANRVWEGSTCSFCSGRLPFPGETDLATTHPWLVDEWDEDENDLTPQDVTRGSNYRAHWICSINPEHKWVTEVCNRTTLGAGCPFCGAQRAGDANARPKPGQSLGDLYPEIAAQWSKDKNGDVTPFDVKPKSEKTFFWTCNVEEHEDYQMSVCNQVVSVIGCPICRHASIGSQNAAPRHNNSLAEVRPDLVKDWDEEKNGKSATEVCYASGLDAYWICEKHGTYVMPPYRRTTGGCGCPDCGATISRSFPEKVLFYYVKMHFPDAVPNYRSPELNIGRHELDIWIPSLRTGAEYDGQYWHQDVTRDAAKDNACANNGIRLIRVRESNCPEYETSSIMIYRKTSTPESLEEAVCETLRAIGHHGDVDIDVNRDRIEILAES